MDKRLSVSVVTYSLSQWLESMTVKLLNVAIVKHHGEAHLNSQEGAYPLPVRASFKRWLITMSTSKGLAHTHGSPYLRQFFQEGGAADHIGKRL
jgi:hypothetical protein